MTTMDDLAAFIEARLADDEMLSAELHRTEWCNSIDRDGGYEEGRCDCGYPARVLREVAAKRLTLKLHDRVHTCPVIVPVSDPTAFAEGMYVSDEYVDDDSDVTPCTTMRLLAAAWSDHGDYRAEWATA
jgi:hypothetical protein